VFIPLGGSRGTTAMIYRNVILVMLVSGVWHGAGLNFVVWGLWHGILLAIHRLWTTYRRRPEGQVPPLLFRCGAWLITYVMANLGWAFFAMDLETALFFFQRLIGG
jgi:alginate O-acetyltransferase complex protein AlgI